MECNSCEEVGLGGDGPDEREDVTRVGHDAYGVRVIIERRLMGSVMCLEMEPQVTEGTRRGLKTDQTRSSSIPLPEPPPPKPTSPASHPPSLEATQIKPGPKVSAAHPSPTLPLPPLPFSRTYMS